MAMSTQIWADAGQLLNRMLVDEIQIYNVGEPKTVGIVVTRDLTPVGRPVPGLVQQTILANAIESRTDTTFSVKVALSIPMRAGQAVKVLRCKQDPTMEGLTLLLDKVSLNGLAMIRKGVASSWDQVDEQGKKDLA